MPKRVHSGKPSVPYTPPPPCPLPYAVDGSWTAETTRAAQSCVREGLQRDLRWWRSNSCRGGPARLDVAPDLDGTLCRLRGVSSRSVLTNMLLLQSRAGRLSATIMLDPSDGIVQFTAYVCAVHGGVQVGLQS